jgi:hypothetical protein
MFPNLNNSNNKEYSLLLITTYPTLSYFGAKAKEVFGNVFPTSIHCTHHKDTRIITRST